LREEEKNGGVSWSFWQVGLLLCFGEFQTTRRGESLRLGSSDEGSKEKILVKTANTLI